MTEEPQLTLPVLLNTVIKSYDSQKVHLTIAWQIEEIILTEENLTDLQHNDLHDQYTGNIKEVAARQVFTIKWGQREGDDCGEAPPGETGDGAVEPPQMPWDANQGGSHLENLQWYQDDDDDTT